MLNAFLLAVPVAMDYLDLLYDCALARLAGSYE